MPSVLRQRSLGDFVTFRAGAVAEEILAIPSGRLLEEHAQAGHLPSDVSMVLGGGSNVLPCGARVAGTTLRLARDEPAPRAEPGPDGVVWLDAAWRWDDVARQLTVDGWRGLESMVGIPGTVGGALVQSIGAYGYELRDGDLVAEARAVRLSTGEVVRLQRHNLDLGYRRSALKGQRPELVITAVALRVRRGGLHLPKHDEVATLLRALDPSAEGGFDPELVMHVVTTIRHGKRALYDRDDSETWGAGSFFTNPTLRLAEVPRLPEALRIRVGRLFAESGRRAERSVPAAWFVEHAGYRRGYDAGRVGLSYGHVLFIVNRTGDASPEDILSFASEIRRRVYDRTNGVVALHPEPVLHGGALSPVDIRR